MSRHCTVCESPNLHDVDRALQSGESQRSIAGRFFLSPSAVQRHSRHATAATPLYPDIQELRARMDGLERGLVCLARAHDEHVRSHTELTLPRR